MYELYTTKCVVGNMSYYYSFYEDLPQENTKNSKKKEKKKLTLFFVISLFEFVFFTIFSLLYSTTNLYLICQHVQMIPKAIIIHYCGSWIGDAYVWVNGDI